MRHGVSATFLLPLRSGAGRRIGAERSESAPLEEQAPLKAQAGDHSKGHGVTRKIDLILTECAEDMEAASIAYVEDANYWIVAFEEEMPLYLNPTEREHHWVLSGPVCDPPEIGTSAFIDLVMIYNGQPELSGGYRIGFDEPEGMLKLSVDLSPLDLARDRFLAMSSEFRRCRYTWEAVAENWRQAGDAATDVSIPPHERV